MGTGGPPSDAELIRRHARGDPAAFGELVARHRDRLWAVALRTLGGDREEAADALQDALVSAFRAAHRFRGTSAVTTWLHRIVVNACLDRARRAAARPASALPEGEARDRITPPEEPAEASVVRGEIHDEVLAALRELPPDQRAALVLVDMEGYPVAEAARLLDVPPGTVKSRCARGRVRLLPLLRHLRAGRGPGRPREGGGNPSGAPPVTEASTPRNEQRGGPAR